MDAIEQTLILNCQERIVNIKRALLDTHPNDHQRRDALNEELATQERKLNERLSR